MGANMLVIKLTVNILTMKNVVGWFRLLKQKWMIIQLNI